MRITRSARRHGVSDEAIRHAVANASGQMLELAARPTEAAGDLVVFHAMPLRLANAKRYLP